MKLEGKIFFRLSFDQRGVTRISGSMVRNPKDRVLVGVVTKGRDEPVTGMSWSAAGFWYKYLDQDWQSSRFIHEFVLPEAANSSRVFFIDHWSGDGEVEIDLDVRQIDVPGKPSVFVLGSCVSRDCFDRADAPTLGEYYARTSLVSSMSTNSSLLEDLDLTANPSSFQRRMVHADLTRSVQGKLLSSDSSLLVVDFIDERFDVARLPWGGFFTVSDELKATQPDSTTWSIQPKYKEGYFTEFRRCWNRLLDVSEGKKILLNRVYWATQDEKGEDLPNQRYIQKNNEVLARLYGIVEEESKGISLVQFTPDEFVADSHHKWGRSPFHYTTEFERQLVSSLWSSLSNN